MHAPGFRITFDGVGLNNLDDIYRARLATLSTAFPDARARATFGRYVERAVNAHEEMLAALKAARHKIEMWPEGSNPEYFPEIKAIDHAIAKAAKRQP